MRAGQQVDVEVLHAIAVMLEQPLLRELARRLHALGAIQLSVIWRIPDMSQIALRMKKRMSDCAAICALSGNLLHYALIMS